MVALKTIMLFASLTEASFLQKRDINLIIGNLIQIDSATNNFTRDVKAWDGSSAGLRPIIQDCDMIETTINATTKAYTKETVFNSANSKTVVSYVCNVLLPDIKTALAAFKAKKTKFDELGTQSVYQSKNKKIKAEGDLLGSTAKGKTSQDQMAAIQSAINTFDSVMTGP